MKTRETTKTPSGNDFQEYLRHHLGVQLTTAGRVSTSPSQSLSKLARSLGYRSQRSVGMLLSGERLPSTKMLLKIGAHLRLSHSEQRKLELLAEKERRLRNGESVEATIDELNQLQLLDTPPQPISDVQFAYIANWYNLVIKQMLSTKNFRFSVPAICERLRKKVSGAEVRLAIENMLRLKLIVPSNKPQKYQPVPNAVFTTHDLPSQAVRRHHKEMLQRAIEAVEEQSVDERELCSLILRFQRSDMNEAKKALREFRDEFDRKFSQESARDIYQLNIQFFAHTTNENKGSRNNVPN